MKRKTVIQLLCVSASAAILLWLLGRVGRRSVGHALGKIGWKGLTALMPGWIESLTDAAALWVMCLLYLAVHLLIRHGAARGITRMFGILPMLRRHSGHWLESAHTIDYNIKQFWHDRPGDYLKVFGFQAAARVAGWASICATSI